MRQSQLFGKTLRENPKDEVAANAMLLERGGFVYKSMAGVYEYLPLGFRVLNKINAIIREEMDAIGGQELLLAALQPKERWMKTGRWNTLGEIMYQFKDHSGRETGLASTHEEVVAEIASRYISSYKDLPLYVYQIQGKFRDEPRAKSGLMRGREFLMKDLYSFHRDQKDLERFYALADKAYRKIFKRCGLTALVTEASGGTFTKDYTHEYQVLSEAGEDWTIYCAKGDFAQNKEISKLKEGDDCPSCGSPLVMGRSIEVGNIFKLGTKNAEAFGLYHVDEKGASRPVYMGSYGIGPGRVMGTVVEVHHDERGVKWPEPVAPFRVHLVELSRNSTKVNPALARKSGVKKAAETLYEKLLAKGIEVLYDDRDDKTPGEKFADADLIGIPWRIVVSEKTFEKKAVEMKARSSQKAEFVPYLKVLEKFLKPQKKR